MTVRLTEWDKNETGWTAIEVTANKVINLLLRSENNLIWLDDNEIYVDLQLEDWLTPNDTLPVWVTTWRIVENDWWDITWTMLSYKTTSWDYVLIVYWDDWKLYVDNWTGTFTQVYLKPEVDALFTQLRSEISAVGYSWEYSDLLHKPTLWTASSLNVGTNPWDIPVVQQNWLLADSIIPKKISSTYVVQTVSDLTGITQAVAWDLAVVTQDSTTYILQQDPYSVANNWVELLSPWSSVTSVNWQTWAVVLNTLNVPQAWNNQYISSTERAVWNAKLWTNDVATVALTGNYNDLGNKPVVDTALSTSSTNAVQNKAIATAINAITWDITALPQVEYLTQDEYDALPSDKETNGYSYFIYA